jgi:hypothetical protein
MVSYNYRSLLIRLKHHGDGIEHLVQKTVGYLTYSATICDYTKYNRKLRFSYLKAYQKLQQYLTN